MTDIVEINVNTGETVSRSYTQEELDYIDYLNAQLAERLGVNDGN